MLVEPDVRVGEWVIVAGSLIIRRLDADAAGQKTHGRIGLGGPASEPLS